MMDFLSNLSSALVGALIGTGCGAYFISRWQDRKMKKIRNIAEKALKFFLPYETYHSAENEFNTKFSVAEKRIVLVALYKLEVPLIIEKGFNVKKVQFSEIRVNKEEIDAMLRQIETGYCDHLYYMDPESFFNENIKIATFRNLAKRWVKEVFYKSVADFTTNSVTFPIDWAENFSYAERLSLLVFKERICCLEYFSKDGKPKLSKMETIEDDINSGFWDFCLSWDYESYSNIKASIQANAKIINMIDSSQPIRCNPF